MTDEPPMWRLVLVAVAGIVDALAAGKMLNGSGLGLASMAVVLLAAGWVMAQNDHTYLRARGDR